MRIRARVVDGTLLLQKEISHGAWTTMAAGPAANSVVEFELMDDVLRFGTWDDLKAQDVKVSRE